MPLQRYVATVTLEAGDRRQPHVLALGIELRHAAGPRARAARHGGARCLRSRLRQPAPASAARRRSARAGRARRCPPRCRCRRAAYRRASAMAMPTSSSPKTPTCPAPAAGEVRIRQRAIGVNYLDVYLRKGWIPPMLAEGGTPGMEAAGSVLDVGDERQRPDARRPRGLPRPGARRVLQRALRAGRLGACACPPAVEDDTAAALLLKGLTADYLLHDLGRVGPGTRAAGARRRRRRRPAGVRVGAPAGRHRHRHRVERRQGAPCARTRLRACDRDARLPLCRRGAAPLRRRRRADRRPRRLRRATKTSPRWPPRPLDQPGPGHRRAATRWTPTLLVAKSLTFSRPVVFDYVATRAALAATRAAPVGTRSPTAAQAAADRAPLARSRRRRRMRGSNRARTSGALVLIA